MDVDVSKVGERGQIVIPQEIRERLKIEAGERFLVISENDDIVFRPIRKIKSLNEIEEDIIDMKIAERRWREIEEGKQKGLSEKEFLKELEKW
jgi:AbrB family looped-hinge helix DNA binding protein